MKQPRNRHIESLGYISDLISEDIPDPVVHFKAVVENMNRQRTEEFDEKTRPGAFTANVEKNVGYFLRLLEIKCFDNKVNAYDLISFIRDFRIVDKGDNQYINISSNRQFNETIKKLTGLMNLDALVLTKREVDNLFDNSMIIPSKVL